jgi:hypothetical protein
MRALASTLYTLRPQHKYPIFIVLIKDYINFCHYVPLMIGKWTWNIGGMIQGTTGVLRWKLVPVPLRRPQTSHNGRSEIEPRPPWLKAGCLVLVIPRIKDQVIPVQTWAGREISRWLRLSHFKTVGTWRWEAVSHKNWQLLRATETFLVLISVRDWVDPRAIGLSAKNSNATGGNRIHDLVPWSAVWPQYRHKLGNNLCLLCES